MSKVYWIKGRSESVRKSLISKINGLLRLEEMQRMIEENKSIAIKFNLSELGYAHYLPPLIVASFFDKLRELGMQAVATDTCTLYKGSRHTGYDFMNTALLQGYSSGETFDNQIMLAAGYTSEEGNFHSGDGEHLGGIELGSLMTDTNHVIVLSHVTAHPLMGLTGAIYNLGLGFLTASGKLRIHESLNIRFDESRCDNCGLCLPYCPTGAIHGDGKVSFDKRICNSCLGCFLTCPRGAIGIDPENIAVFQEMVVEAALTAKRQIRGHSFFISFLGSVTPQCDDHPFSDVPFVPDLGILASDDPVALDFATHQMILRGPGLPGSAAQDFNVLEKGQDKIKAITGQNPEHYLQYAEGMKLGTIRSELLISA